MAKRLLDVGSCGPDHGALTQLVQQNFDATVTQAHGFRDAIDQLRAESFDLVTINRLMDRDSSSGLEILAAIKGDSQLDHVPVMLVTNYDEYQQIAIAGGAEPGFGKANLRDPATVELLRPFLTDAAANAPPRR